MSSRCKVQIVALCRASKARRERVLIVLFIERQSPRYRACCFFCRGRVENVRTRHREVALAACLRHRAAARFERFFALIRVLRCFHFDVSLRLTILLLYHYYLFSKRKDEREEMKSYSKVFALPKRLVTAFKQIHLRKVELRIVLRVRFAIERPQLLISMIYESEIPHKKGKEPINWTEQYITERSGFEKLEKDSVSFTIRKGNIILQLTQNYTIYSKKAT